MMHRVGMEYGEQNPPEAYTRPYVLATIYMHLGEIDKALANLQIAFRERDEQMIELSVEPQFDPLRKDSSQALLSSANTASRAQRTTARTISPCRSPHAYCHRLRPPPLEPETCRCGCNESHPQL